MSTFHSPRTDIHCEKPERSDVTSQGRILSSSALEGMVNGKKVRGRRRYQMINNIMKHGLYEDTKRKAKKRVEWSMLSLQ